MRAALVGDGIAASLTPAMHMAEGAAQGVAYSYERWDTKRLPWQGLGLAAILDRAEAEGLVGLNITHPHKTRVAPLLDELAGPAADLGTVNTVVFRDGRRIGHTTDYAGFAMALGKSGLPVGGKPVIQFGAGGAGAACALALLDAGAQLTLADIDPDRASALAERLAIIRPDALVTSETPESVPLSGAAGAVNATPLGMDAYPGMAFDPTALPDKAWVADIVYFPLETALIRAARASGRSVLPGGEMAVYQAVAAFELLTGKAANAERMRRHFLSMVAGESVASPSGA